MVHSSVCGRKDADSLFSSDVCVYTYMYVYARIYMEFMADLILILSWLAMKHEVPEPRTSL